MKAATGARNKTRATSGGAAVLPVTVSLPARHGAFWRQLTLPLLIFVFAAGLRFYNLGAAAFRADEGMFPELCRLPGVTPGALFVNWTKIAGENSQLPFPCVVAKSIIDLFHWPVTEFTTRVSAATFGSLAVLVAFFAGRLLMGRRFGAFFALLVALNPAHIQCSMEAYFYSPLMLGSMLLLWSVAWCFRYRRMPAWPWKFYVAGWLGVLLSAYSHYSGWWLSALWGLVAAGVGVFRFRIDRPAVREMTILFGGCMLIALPVIFLPWGLPWFLKLASPKPGATDWIPAIYAYNRNPLGIVASFARETGWGGNTVRMMATICFGVMAGTALARGWRKAVRAWIVVGVFLAGLAILHFASIASGFPPGPRYFFFAHPFFLALLAMGIWTFPSNRLVRRWFPPLMRRAAAFGVAAFAVLLLVYPAYASTQLKGKPTPYKEIQRWVDTQLPAGTLILVDRWYEAYCELQSYNPSTNVFFTFALPSEPSAVALKLNWRKSVEAFFEKFPDALYMPMVKSYTWDPVHGPWPWPDTYFKHTMAIATNEAGLMLGECGGVGFRGGEYADTTANRLRVLVQFNTRADILQMARERGRTTVVLYAPGWGYTKLWRQIQGDFRDWRVLRGVGTLDVYNLIGAAKKVTITIRGVAVNGGKRLQASNGSEFRFPQGQIVEWRIEDVELKPEKNALTLKDLGPANSVLLVEDVRVE